MLLLAVLVTMNAVLMLPPLLVDIAAEFGASVSVVGQLATATFGAWAVSLVLASPLSDSLGRRLVALAGLLVLSTAVIASALAPNLNVLLVLRLLTGLGGNGSTQSGGRGFGHHFSGEARPGGGRLDGGQRAHSGYQRTDNGPAGRLGQLAGDCPSWSRG